MIEDPRKKALFVVRLVGDAKAGKTSLGRALLDFPAASDEDLTRIKLLDGDAPLDDEEAVAPPGQDAIVFVVRGAPGDDARAKLDAAGKDAKQTFVAVHARDLEIAPDDDARDAWGKLAPPSHVYLTSTPPAGVPHGVDELRAALLQAALEGMDATVERARRAKRPYATAIVAGAALVTAAEGFLPGTAAFVVATQVGAITSLYYLYTGKWMGRTQALSLIPVFASEAAGGSAFLLIKSFLPPTGFADVAAAGVAAMMTITMLGAVTWALEQGYSLEERSQLRLAFRRLRAKTKAERAAITRNRHRWKDKQFWTDVVRRLIFE